MRLLRTAPASFRRRSALHAAAVSAVLLSSLAVACGPSEAEQKAKLDEVQTKANEQIASAQKDVAAKLALADKQIADLKSALADAGAEARAEAQTEIAKVKADVDKLVADASLALAKARSAYKESASKQLQALNTEANELSTKSKKAPAKSKASIDKSLKDITTKRQNLQKDIAGIDKATVEQLKTAKAKVDSDLAQLKAAIAILKAKLPKD
jgi:DNA repair exonuclease SbcCD ATPase subunit